MVYVCASRFDNTVIPSAIPIEMMFQAELFVRNGIAIKNRFGQKVRVFEPIIEDNEDEIIIRLRKDESELE